MWIVFTLIFAVFMHLLLLIFLDLRFSYSTSTVSTPLIVSGPVISQKWCFWGIVCIWRKSHQLWISLHTSLDHNQKCENGFDVFIFSWEILKSHTCGNCLNWKVFGSLTNSFVGTHPFELNLSLVSSFFYETLWGKLEKKHKHQKQISLLWENNFTKSVHLAGAHLVRVHLSLVRCAYFKGLAQ